MTTETFGQRVDRLMAQEFPGVTFETCVCLNLFASMPCTQIMTRRTDGEPMTKKQRRVCQGISVALVDIFGEAYRDAMFGPRGEWTDLRSQDEWTDGK